MSKLIVEMEMPERCGACKCRQVEFDIDRVDVFCGIKDNEYVEDADSRPSWCPIIGELPEQHGRLVDADAKYLGVLNYGNGTYANFNTTISETLGKENMRNVKVIVPATERSEA